MACRVRSNCSGRPGAAWPPLAAPAASISRGDAVACDVRTVGLGCMDIMTSVGGSLDRGLKLLIFHTGPAFKYG